MPQLTVLLDLANKIFTTNVQIVEMLVRLQSKGVRPETQYTWFQLPVKFEDGLGRMLPVPSEYNWNVTALG